MSFCRVTKPTSKLENTMTVHLRRARPHPSHTNSDIYCKSSLTLETFTSQELRRQANKIDRLRLDRETEFNSARRYVLISNRIQFTQVSTSCTATPLTGG